LEIDQEQYIAVVTHVYTSFLNGLQIEVLTQKDTDASVTLQSVLHSAARVIMRKRKFERISPTLRDDLHWLPVPERIVFKLCTIIFKCLQLTTPQYLQELCVPVTASTSRCHLRSAARSACLSYFQLRTTQLSCLRSKTIEQSAVVIS